MSNIRAKVTNTSGNTPKSEMTPTSRTAIKAKVASNNEFLVANYSANIVDIPISVNVTHNQIPFSRVQY
jgi:hypothetical protein